MQALSFGWQEFVRPRLACGTLFAERVTHAPEPEIEPRPCVERINCVKTEQIADRAFESNCRWMARCDTGILSGFARVADDGDIAGLLVQQRHMNLRGIAP
jgi:hypothetical protein